MLMSGLGILIMSTLYCFDIGSPFCFNFHVQIIRTDHNSVSFSVLIPQLLIFGEDHNRPIVE